MQDNNNEESFLENYFEGVVSNDLPIWRWSGVDDFGHRLQLEVLENLRHARRMGKIAELLSRKREG
jgi:hypothetical protein